MKAVQTTYCTKQFLDDAYSFRKESRPHKIALRIIENLSNVVIDMDTQELQKLIEENPYYHKLYKREGKTLEAKIGWANNISFESNSDSLYLIHPNYIPKYKSIRKETGSLIVCNDTDINLLKRMNDKRGYICLVPEDYRRDCLKYHFQETWEEAVSTCKIEPINSLIISDNYLFSNIDSRKRTSLFSLLHAIIPDTLTVPFHLAMFANIENAKFYKEEAENLVDEIKNLFPYDEVLFPEGYIKVTIILHQEKKTTHDRVILSNYHMLTSGIGFNVIDEDGIKMITKGFIESVYHEIEATPDKDMITKHFHDLVLQWLRNIYRNHKNVCIYGDKQHRMLD